MRTEKQIGKTHISARLTEPLIEIVNVGYQFGYSDAEMVREGIRLFGTFVLNMSRNETEEERKVDAICSRKKAALEKNRENATN